jgi:II/X family phage/plasmid replication protein
MIDWLTVRIPLLHMPINDGCVVNFDRDKKPVYSVDKKLKVESSHSTSVQVRSSGELDFHGFDKFLLIDGNLNKFFNGHNITGTDNVTNLIVRFMDYLLDRGDLVLQPYHLKTGRTRSVLKYQELIYDGDFIVKRIDINYMFRVTGGSVDEYVDFMADTTRTRFGRTTQPGEGTVYWNQRSTHWSMKCYNKHKELNARKKSHQLPNSFTAHQKKALLDFVEPYARFELVLRARKLREIAEKLGYNDAYWHAFERSTDEHNRAISPSVLFETYMAKIQVNDMERYSVDEAIQLLKPFEYGTFAAWRSGYNVKDNMTKPTYYRHRKAILDALGVDIALSAQNADKHAGQAVRTFRIVQADNDFLCKQVEQILKAA